MKLTPSKIGRFIHYMITFSLFVILPVELEGFFDTPCAADEYFDGVVEMCSKCSEVCLLNDPNPKKNQYCKVNCPDYYKRVVQNSSAFTTVNVVEKLLTSPHKTTTADDRVPHSSNELFRKPLFWTSVFSLVISVIATITLFVLCIVRASSRQALLHRRTRIIRGVPLTSKKVDKSSLDNVKGRCLDPPEESLQNCESSPGNNSTKEQIIRTSCDLTDENITNSHVTPRYSISDEGSSSCEGPRGRSELVLACKGDNTPQALQLNKNMDCTLNVITGDMVEGMLGICVEHNSHYSKIITFDSVADVIICDTSSKRADNGYNTITEPHINEENCNYKSPEKSPRFIQTDSTSRFKKENTATSAHCNFSDTFDVSCEKESKNKTVYPVLKFSHVNQSAAGDSLEILETARAAAAAGAMTTCAVGEKEVFPWVDALNVKLNVGFRTDKEVHRYQNHGCVGSTIIQPNLSDKRYSQTRDNQEIIPSWEEVLKSCGVNIRQYSPAWDSVTQFHHDEKLNCVSSMQFKTENNVV